MPIEPGGVSRHAAQKRSGEVGAPVDHDRLAIDVGPVVGEQESHHRSKVLRDAKAIRPHRCEDLTTPFLGGVFQRRSREDHPRRDRIASHAMLAADRGGVASEPIEPGLRRLVGNMPIGGFQQSMQHKLSLWRFEWRRLDVFHVIELFPH